METEQLRSRRVREVTTRTCCMTEQHRDAVETDGEATCCNSFTGRACSAQRDIGVPTVPGGAEGERGSRGYHVTAQRDFQSGEAKASDPAGPRFIPRYHYV
jgi:hypothetical protein